MSSISPLVPALHEQQTVYLVLDNFGGRTGRSWRETDEDRTSLAELMTDLMDGQYNDPIRVVAFNSSEGWAKDASREVADLIAKDCVRDGFDLPPFLRSFVEQHRSRRPANGTPAAPPRSAGS